MNHIKELTIVRDGLSKEFKAYIGSIEDLKLYLLSDKFSVDTTVQVSDVISRLDAALAHAIDVRTEHDNAAYKEAREQDEKPKLNCECCTKFTKDTYLVYSPAMGTDVVICGKCIKRNVHHSGELWAKVREAR